jgi:glucokinase
MSVVGIDVGGTSIKAARFGTDDVIAERIVLATPGEQPAITTAVLEVAAKLATDDVQAVGVVVPGDVDARTGIVRYSANVNWQDVPLRALLRADLAVPVAVDNDVIAAALAEAERSDGDLLYVALGTGIGGALVLGGAVVRGASGLSAEIGHIPVYPDGEACLCGQRGCLEVYASAAGLARRYVAAGGSELTAAELVGRLDTDPIAAAVWREATTTLAIALATATLLLDPARIVFGGGLAEAGDLLLAPVRTELDPRLTWHPAPPLSASTLGLDAGIRGAASLARALISEPGKVGFAQ